MKTFFVRSRIPLALIVSALIGAGTAWLLAQLLQALNVTGETAAYAPAWARALYEGANRLSLLSFFVSACVLLCIGTQKSAFSVQQLLAFFAGAAVCALMLAALLLAGSMRFSESAVRRTLPETILTELNYGFCFAFTALLLRKHPGKCKSRTLRLSISALGESAILFLGFSLSIAAAVNGLMLGILLFFVYERQKSIHSEILFLSAFRLTESVVFASPDLGGAYPVSENLLTGGNAGLFASGILMLLLAACIAAGIFAHVRKKHAS